MKKIVDIRPPARSKTSPPNSTIALVELTPKSSKIGSRRSTRHTHDYSFSADLPTQKPWQARAQELGRMMVMGMTMVVLLNGINVYYRGLEVKESVAGAAYDTYEQFIAQGLTADSLEGVHSTLDSIQSDLWFLQNQRQTVWSNQEATHAVEQILNAGSDLTEAGAELFTFVEESKEVLSHLLEEKPDELGASLTEDWKVTYVENFQPALATIQQATLDLNAVNADVLPQELSANFEAMRGELDSVNTALTTFDAHFPTLLSLLGDEHPQRILILLENNRESRPGGGFIGSYLIVDVNDGYLDGMTFNDVYELDGQYHEFIEPPVEIARLTNEWRFRDSNYSPDMSVSAAKAAWFLEEEGGPGVDQVITVDLSFVTELLAILGPVKIDSLPTALNEENFVSILSYLVEAKWSGAQAPKTILGEFVTQATEQIRSQKPWEALSQLFQTMAQEKHVAAYSKHENIHSFFEEFGLTGSVATPPMGEDALMVIHTSVGGNKTDAWVSETQQHDTYLSEDGLVTDRLTLTRTHQWTDTEESKLLETLSAFGFASPEPWLIDLLGRGPNVSAFRVYVPRGSELVGVEGLDESEIERHYDEDLGLDYFSFNQTLYSGTTDAVSLTYTLPNVLTFDPLAEYRLAVFKQPGSFDQTFTKTIQADPTLSQVRSFPETLLEEAHEETLGLYTWTTALDRDLNVAQLWSR